MVAVDDTTAAALSRLNKAAQRARGAFLARVAAVDSGFALAVIDLRGNGFLIPNRSVAVGDMRGVYAAEQADDPRMLVFTSDRGKNISVRFEQPDEAATVLNGAETRRSAIQEAAQEKERAALRTALGMDRDLNNADVLVRSCYYLGGSGLSGLTPGNRINLVFNGEHLQFYPSPDKKVATERPPVTTVAQAELTEIELHGPGRVTRSAGVIGGGFGIQGALEGMAVAAIINALSTRTTITSYLDLLGSTWEAFFVNDALSPTELRRVLSPVFVQLRGRDGADEPLPSAPPTGAMTSDLVSSLERVAALRSAGVLTQDEFERAKERLLNS